MNEILVLCLTRFGDLIQASPLLRGLRREHPGARITLAVQKGFDAILPMMGDFDRSFVFEQDEAARKIALEEDPLATYGHIDAFMRLLEADRYDMVVNLTCSKLSAYMVSLMDSRDISGITCAPDGRRVINNPWGTYLFSFLYGDSRRWNRINLVDIFTRLGRVQPDGKPVELSETSRGRNFAEGFVEKEGLQGKRLVGIQLGASESARCWPLESFARLSDRIQQEAGVRTVLFGAPKERELAERACAMMRTPPVNAVGETRLDDLFSLLKQCSLLITNDTGTMHFAAAAGAPVLMLNIGPAFFQCTGPYSAGNLSLKPALACSPCRYNLNCLHPVCLESLDVDAVHTAAMAMLDGDAASLGAIQGVEVHRSGFGKDGYLAWEGLCNVDQRGERLGKRYAELWKKLLDGAPPSGMGEGSGVFREFAAMMDEGKTIAEGIMQAARANPLPMERVKELGDAESELEKRMRLMGSHCTEVAPIVDYISLMRENMTAEGLESIAAETLHIYETGKRLAAGM